MKNRGYILIFFMALALSLQGCDKWLSVQPSDRQTESQLFETKSGFYSAVNGVYAQLGSSSLYGENLSFGVVEILGKRYSNYSSSNKAYLEFDKASYSTESTAPIIEAIWNTAYDVILNCNIIIKNAEEQEGILSKSEANVIIGEMIGLRAFIHFDLLRMFGPIYKTNPEGAGVVYNTSSVVQVEDILSAKDIIENYILKDIEVAENILKDIDNVITSGASFPNALPEGGFEPVVNDKDYRQIRFNYYALLALKARVQLYSGNKIEALKVAKQVIDAPEMSTLFPFVDPTKLLGNTKNPDRGFSTEVLFGLYDSRKSDKDTKYFDTNKASTYLLQPRTSYVKDVLFKNMSGDYRFVAQWGAYSSGVNQDYVSFKYKNDENTKQSFFATFVPLIRLSEMYLIAAECETDNTLAVGYMNTLKAARGSVVFEGNSTELLKEIIREYLRETYGEGQSFYLFKRLNTSISAEYNGNANSSVSVTTARFVIPLPESETLPR